MNAPRGATAKTGTMTSPIIIQRLENAIDITIEAMTLHSLPQLLPTLKRLETERDKLVSEGDPLEYAKSYGRNVSGRLLE